MNIDNLIPKEIPSDDLSIEPSSLCSDAIFIVNTLIQKGYEAYIVGGAVRDLIIGKKPKDFDIATNAVNSQIKEVFPNCELIGRRFPIALVHLNRNTIEVSTFVSKNENQKVNAKDQRSKGQDRESGSLAYDAFRRDFTINALYLDIEKEVVIDFFDGVEDIRKKQIKFIGDPKDKCLEDPVRMVRALRQKAQLQFNLDGTLVELINLYHSEISKCSQGRLIEELMKLFRSGFSKQGLNDLESYGLLKEMFPKFSKYFAEEKQFSNEPSILDFLDNFDEYAKVVPKIREPIVFSALSLAKVYRENPELWESDKPNGLFIQKYDDYFSSIWVELSVKRWVKSKLLTMLMCQWKFHFKDRIPSLAFVQKEYFKDSFRMFRLFSETSKKYEESLNVWKVARFYPDIARPIFSWVLKNGMVTESNIPEIKKSLGKPQHGKKYKKKYYRKKPKQSGA